MINSMASEQVAVVGAVDPDAYSAGTNTTAWISAANFFTFLALILVGDSGGVVDAKIEQATDAAGTGVKDVAGKAITQLAGTSDNVQAAINLRPEDLDVSNNFSHFRLSITTGSTSDAGGLVLGSHPRHGPASDNDAATVVEIIS